MTHIKGLADFVRPMVRGEKPVEPNKAALTQRKNIILDAAEDYAEKDVAARAAGSIQQWAETTLDDLDEGEGMGDRLLSMFVGIVDENKDGEITPEESEVLDAALNAGWDYLTAKGVSEDDATSLLSDFENDTAERIKDLIIDAIPDGEGAMDDIDNFAFDRESSEAVFDAVYKKRMVVRGGKKMRVNKRVAGTVRLNGKQKVAIRKARMKSHSAMAVMHRMKSLKVRKNLGM